MMTCRVCETAIAGRARFCPECGTRVSLDPPPFERSPSRASPPGHVLAHRQALGVLWCVEGAVHLVACVFLAVIFLMPMTHAGGPRPLSMPGLILLIPALLGLIALLSLVVGYGLLTHRRWGRSTALVAGVLSLPNVPLGTLLGAYTLWVLGSQAAGVEWMQLSD